MHRRAPLWDDNSGRQVTLGNGLADGFAIESTVRHNALIGPVVWSSSGPTCETLPSLVVVKVAGTIVLVATPTANWSFLQVRRPRTPCWCHSPAQ
jgi:hypothetical protein